LETIQAEDALFVAAIGVAGQQQSNGRTENHRADTA
jgi:hypothetical protein